MTPIDGAMNGKFLPRTKAESMAVDLPQHPGWNAEHSAYNSYVNTRLNEIYRANPHMTPAQAAKALGNLSRELTNDIVGQQGGTRLNRPCR